MFITGKIVKLNPDYDPEKKLTPVLVKMFVLSTAIFKSDYLLSWDSERGRSAVEPTVQQKLPNMWDCKACRCPMKVGC